MASVLSKIPTLLNPEESDFPNITDREVGMKGLLKFERRGRSVLDFEGHD